MRILESNTNVLQLLRDLSIPIIPFISENENAPYCINNQVGRMKDLNLGVLIDAGLVDDRILKISGLCRQMTFDQVLDLAFHDAEDFIQTKNNRQILIHFSLQVHSLLESFRESFLDGWEVTLA